MLIYLYRIIKFAFYFSMQTFEKIVCTKFAKFKLSLLKNKGKAFFLTTTTKQL